MIKGAVFDMDGLMFDTENLTYRAWQKAMDDAKIPYSFEIYKKTIGKRTAEVQKFYKALYGEGFDYQSLRSAGNRYFSDEIQKNGVPVKRGLYNILKFFRDNSVKIALATSSSRAYAVEMLKKAKVESYFDAYICGDTVKNGKPHPEVFLTAAKALDLSKDDCIVFEDSLTGVDAGINAKMRVIMIPDFIKPDDERKAKLFGLFDDLDQARDFLLNTYF